MADRSLTRDVHIYSARDTNTVLGGLAATNGITNANFYSMVEVVFIFDEDYRLCTESGATVQRDSRPLQAGKYLIDTAGSLQVNNEPWLVRTESAAANVPDKKFLNAVRRRDRRCVITGERPISAVYGFWEGLTATHIFPPAYEQYWSHYFNDFQTAIPGSRGSTGINSVQNGMLLRSDICALFETYTLSINPDDGYKIVSFMPDGKRIAGKHLDKTFLEHPKRPVDQLLRWHFRQAVLANVRGVRGEPLFDSDFPPGSDVMGEILSAPMAGERMEFELFTRLAGLA